MIMTSTSRGRVSISSSSATDSPVIDTDYMSTETDRTALLHASCRILTAMLSTHAMNDYIEAQKPPSGAPRLKDLEPLTATSSDAEILERIRRTDTQHYH